MILPAITVSVNKNSGRRADKKYRQNSGERGNVMRDVRGVCAMKR